MSTQSNKPEKSKEELEADQQKLSKQLLSLQDSIVRKPPYCYGTVPVDVKDCILFYGKDDDARRINLSQATDEQLQHLAKTCDPATFGVHEQDVYDETYRKAGKLDAEHFSLNVTPDHLGLLDIVRDQLVLVNAPQAYIGGTKIRAELYKLNVYGPQSFFKPHVDTPRGETMFGSLVLVFPTSYEGGALVLRERGCNPAPKEWSVDSASLLSQTSSPSIAYVAFFSDVEHEVLPVESGYRVTITYNLHYVSEDEPPAVSPPQPRLVPKHEAAFRATLQGLLDDPTFLPQGGNLLFCLWHQYPLPTPTEDTTLEESRQALRRLADRLKGSDALVLQVVRALGLDASLRIVLRDEGWIYDRTTFVMCDHAVRLGEPLEFGDGDAGNLHGYLLQAKRAILINGPFGPLDKSDLWRYGLDDEGSSDDEPNSDCVNGPMEVHWVNYLHWHEGVDNTHKTTYMAYGNQASIGTAYWRVCLLIRVGPFGQRATMTAGDEHATNDFKVVLLEVITVVVQSYAVY
ncbi:hypothetical protein BN946_scf184836.g25 [Trametes cinnabarina]|uniref:Fe2OG dioxygenase domain-containing protein n=1 Tax=Pycnoporus cinnabarinus TaxID=5643 RepID=A0A060S6W4_PYCCI|nr:hypothetical protein BN946_scf184836.g25 [Trametes cinnabarina]